MACGGAGGGYSVTCAEREISIADYHQELQVWQDQLLQLLQLRKVEQLPLSGIDPGTPTGALD
jgi:hypothetical protein